MRCGFHVGMNFNDGVNRGDMLTRSTFSKKLGGWTGLFWSELWNSSRLARGCVSYSSSMVTRVQHIGAGK